jgi:hypothetical protein
MERLKRKLTGGPSGGIKYLVEPPGQEKMSEVLEAFIEPYMDQAVTGDALRKLLALGVLAWNAALVPDDRRRKMIDGALEGLPKLPIDARTEVRALVNTMIERKEAFFPSNRRAIITFDLTDTGEGYHLSVASTLNVGPDS